LILRFSSSNKKQLIRFLWLKKRRSFKNQQRILMRVNLWLKFLEKSVRQLTRFLKALRSIKKNQSTNAENVSVLTEINS
jgi:hypothetical protein